MKKVLVLFGFLLCLPLCAHANPVVCADATSPCLSGKTYGYTVGNTSPISLLAADGSRRCLLIQNQPQSATSACINLGGTATYTNSLCNGWVLAPGTPFVFSNLGSGNNLGNVPTASISAIGIAGNAQLGYSFCD